MKSRINRNVSIGGWPLVRFGFFILFFFVSFTKLQRNGRLLSTPHRSALRHQVVRPRPTDVICILTRSTFTWSVVLGLCISLAACADCHILWMFFFVCRHFVHHLLVRACDRSIVFTTKYFHVPTVTAHHSCHMWPLRMSAGLFGSVNVAIDGRPEGVCLEEERCVSVSTDETKSILKIRKIHLLRRRVITHTHSHVPKSYQHAVVTRNQF